MSNHLRIERSTSMVTKVYKGNRLWVMRGRLGCTFCMFDNAGREIALHQKDAIALAWRILTVVG